MPTAQEYLTSGISIIRLQLDGSKEPVGRWKPYQHKLPSTDELQEWFGAGQCGMAAVCGPVSANLHVIDIDELPSETLNRLFADIPLLMERLTIVQTPRPGLQLWFRERYRPAGNQVLACLKDGTLWIETRGTGGYVCAPGTPPETHSKCLPYTFIQGTEKTIPLLERDEVQLLMDTCRGYNESSPPQQPEQPAEQPEKPVEQYSGELRPGDIYNQHANFKQLMLNAGWTETHSVGETIYLARPGKTNGHSATLGECRSDDGRPLLHVFSTKAAPFTAKTTYDAFGAYAVLHHGGDMGRAAAAIRIQIEQQAQQVPHSQQAATGLTVCNFTDIQPQPVMWLWDGRFALGKLTLLTGEGGVGKSMLTIDMAARISTGRLFPDGSPSIPGYTMFIGSEDGAHDTVRPRLDAAGADVSKVLLVSGPKPQGSAYADPIDLSLHIAMLDDLLHQYPDTRMLVIDPILDYLGAKTDSHKAEDVRRVLGPLRSVIEKHNVCAVVMNHLNKNTAGSSKSRSLGSGALVHVCRIELRVTEDPDDEDRKLLLPVKNNLAKAAGLAYRIASRANGIGYCEWDPDPVHMSINEAESNNQTSAIDEARDWLTSALADGMKPSADLKKLAASDGVASWPTIERAKKQLPIKARRIDDKWFWEWVSE